MSDAEEQPRQPKRTAVLSTRVTCADNAADLELSFHCKAQEATWPLPAGNTPSMKCKVPSTEASSTESEAECPPKEKKGKCE